MTILRSTLDTTSAEFDAAKATDEGSAAAFRQFEIGEGK